ncbi:MAG: hypothetical protein UT86_C0007G0005 [Candidatus Magasanikbacteria bacterium GW2011_GWC2_40_17]|uniref:Uncharacterized protein n=1 Tax=Candidatus Magasanikbacteria bacterium GW2011_GWA2_42_32 TaxID=1619039 RepID=A0A0G1A6A2_9BACT|nr:MAG: hypothetical protein UT86_C0007G0005 [Candidatus Magasanikbacteria bacterium GW2011_GWC2_40_17]KKS56464.1 MAG: hypothetical protein UV20_C0011G0005 [Candidatus Magasanikbacteria bacterium GW2011_GWA2_42_32]OGH85050.1 MAG: hypothetical protein A2294_01515 [Candidatus Magasanikbacteria bacterium RIFOXYB2_FULL_38_10]
MERKATYLIAGPMLQELKEVLATGDVPSLTVRYNIGAMGDAGGEDKTHSVQVTLLVKIGEYEATITASKSFLLEVKPQNFLQARSFTGEEVSLGIVDLLEGGIRQALVQIFPAWEKVISSSSVSSYVVHSLGSTNSNLVQVIMKFKAELRENGNGKGKGGENSAGQTMDKGVFCYGTETIRASLECLLVFYNWLIWRLMRQENGKKLGKKSR